jgi:hypothetical protein
MIEITGDERMTQVTPNWLGPFYGAELTFQDCEVLTIQAIPRTLMKEEAALMQSKWFDYRRLHPLQATHYFMECYKVAYQEFIRVAVDADRAPFMKPIKGDDFLGNRETLSFWRLRQQADRFGVRYDFFLGRAMKWYMEECFRRVSLHAPRPGHIGANEELLTDLMMDWEERQEVCLQIAADPWYTSENFSGQPHQLDYEEFICKQIEARRHIKYALSASLYTHDALRVETAMSRFGTEMIIDAIEQITIPEQISQQ